MSPKQKQPFRRVREARAVQVCGDALTLEEQARATVGDGPAGTNLGAGDLDNDGR